MFDIAAPALVSLVTSALISQVRLGAGSRVVAASRRPERPLELYEFEACPYCRRVREALSALDLDVLVYPCPKRGRRFRPRVEAMGGKMQFPFLVDPNTNQRLYESNEIVRYLGETYAVGGLPDTLLPGPLETPTQAIAWALRAPRGLLARPSRVPARPLELWSYEASPHCRLVRERLCELELPYALHNVASGSNARAALVARSGQSRVPYLVDPNTGRSLSETLEILRHLKQAYQG